MVLTIEKGLSFVVTVVAIGLSLWHLAIVAGFLTYSTLDIRILHLTVLLSLVFLVKLPRDTSVENGASHRRTVLGLSLRVAGALMAVGAGLYTYIRWRPIAFSGGMTTDMDARVGLIVIALVLIAVSRRIGLFLSLIAVVFLLYPFVSSYLPEIISTRGYGWERVSIFLATGGEGIFGIPLGVSASYIIIFTIFGAFLNNFGAGDFFFQLAHSLTRGARAASAKTAVIFSTMLGMISGSAAGNVAVTGTMTIPMMKREGYSPNQAAAIEAVVSTGGQIMPPIMGAAAFIMAEIIGRPYSEVMTAALIPALLFFSSIFFIVHLQAVKADLPRTEAVPDAPPLLRSLLYGTRFTVPFFTLIGMMLAGYSPFRASFVALILLLVGCTLYEWRDLRGVLRKTLKSLEDGALAVLSIAVACAAAGIVAGVLSMTGLGSKISSLIIVLAAGEPLFALAMTAVLAIILGMGLPTTAAYLILATVVAPPLVQMGVPLLTAHMFVFFFGCISTITPPVALASYVAAGIAGSDINRTSWTAFAYGITSYILPFMFFFSPALLMQGSSVNVAVAVITGLLAVFCISSAVVGYFRRCLNQAGRGVLALSGLLLIYQEQASSVIAMLMLAGVALVIQFGGSRLALLVAK